MKEKSKAVGELDHRKDTSREEAFCIADLASPTLVEDVLRHVEEKYWDWLVYELTRNQPSQRKSRRERGNRPPGTRNGSRPAGTARVRDQLKQVES